MPQAPALILYIYFTSLSSCRQRVFKCIYIVYVLDKTEGINVCIKYTEWLARCDCADEMAKAHRRACAAIKMTFGLGTGSEKCN